MDDSYFISRIKNWKFEKYVYCDFSRNSITTIKMYFDKFKVFFSKYILLLQKQRLKKKSKTRRQYWYRSCTTMSSCFPTYHKELVLSVK